MYEEGDRLCLKWSDFQENAMSAFGTLRKDGEFADITLVCEDGQEVEAHKVILASSSPFFHNLFRRNKHPHPLIFMRGLSSEDLVAMVDFLYFGYVSVNRENLASFLAVAEELQLKGLSGADTEMEDGENCSQDQPKNKSSKHVQQQKHSHDVDLNTVKIKKSFEEEAETVNNSFTVSTDLQDLGAKIKLMMKRSENQASARICKVCGKEGQMSVIQQHIESNHITGVSHACHICGRACKTRDALNKHRRKIHGT